MCSLVFGVCCCKQPATGFVSENLYRLINFFFHSIQYFLTSSSCIGEFCKAQFQNDSWRYVNPVTHSTEGCKYNRVLLYCTLEAQLLVNRYTDEYLYNIASLLYTAYSLWSFKGTPTVAFCLKTKTVFNFYTCEETCLKVQEVKTRRRFLNKHCTTRNVTKSSVNKCSHSSCDTKPLGVCCYFNAAHLLEHFFKGEVAIYPWR